MLRETFMAFSGQYRQVAGCRDGSSPKRLVPFAVGIAAAILVLAVFQPAAVAITINMECSNEGDSVPHDENPSWDTSQLYVDGTLRVAAPGLSGDFNNDGAVDAADYVVWRKTGGPPADYNTWRTNFGNDAAGSGAGLTGTSGNPTVPEPAIGMQLFLAMLVANASVACRRFDPFRLRA